jgi:hypothetical protein
VRDASKLLVALRSDATEPEASILDHWSAPFDAYELLLNTLAALTQTAFST